MTLNHARSSLTTMGMALAVLFVVAPFEPRFAMPFGAVNVSLTEAVAIPVFLFLGLGRPWRGARVPPAVWALGLMAIVGLVSAALSVEPASSVKFALRILAMAGFALLCSRLREDEASLGLQALALSGSLAAILAILEGCGVRSIDILLGLFRETPFNVGGIRRATAGSEYPNLGAAMVVYALLGGVALLRGRSGSRILWTSLLAAGLALTYSRGACVGGAFGLLVLAFGERTRGRWMPLVAYVAVLAAFLGVGDVSRIRFEGENANDFYAATYEVPPRVTLEPSGLIGVDVTVRNTGRRPWRQKEAIHLSYHLFEHDGLPLLDGPRTALPKDVLPGEAVAIRARLHAPAKPGVYALLWDLVHEDTTWFSGQGVRPGVARLIVGDQGASAPATSLDEARTAAGLRRLDSGLAWRPSRWELWTIALRMWAAYPFFGVGPDGYRREYGAWAGRNVFDRRVYANNTALEYAATLGSFGLAAWLAAVVLAGSGWRSSMTSSVGVALLSILVAMVVHGLVDHVLAFTGHYLVFGFAVGWLGARSEGRLA